MAAKTRKPAIEIDGEVFDLAKHNGMVTIQSPRTGEHRTFRIATQKENAKFAPGERIVSLLIGPDRDDYTNWTRFGWVRDGRVIVWSKLTGSADSPSMYDQLGKMLDRPAHYTALGCRYMIETTCRRCNRALTVPSSIDSGYGPECIQMV
jgi:hypothetical protein